MTSPQTDIPNRISTPFKRASKVTLPGRGRFTSAMLAIGAIVLMLLSGVLVFFIYDQTTTQDEGVQAQAQAQTDAEHGEMRRPVVDLAKGK